MPKPIEIHYCRVCKAQIENDTTKGQTKVFCSDKCTALGKKAYLKDYHKKSYQYDPFAQKKSKFPSWKCPVCKFKVQLSFDPRRVDGGNRLKEMTCEHCKQKSTA